MNVRVLLCFNFLVSPSPDSKILVSVGGGLLFSLTQTVLKVSTVRVYYILGAVTLLLGFYFCIYGQNVTIIVLYKENPTQLHTSSTSYLLSTILF